MTDITKVGGHVPTPVSRPLPSKSSKTDDAPSSASGSTSTAAQFRLPDVLAGAGQAGQPLSAADALKAVLDNLSARFGSATDSPPASGSDLESLLGDIKIAAPVLDRVLAARKDELLSSGDQSGLASLDATLASAQDALGQAQSDLEGVSEGLPDETPEQDPALTAALNAVLGDGHTVPTFSAEDLRAGRKEFIGLVFGDITDAISRHRGNDAVAASYTLSSLGGANLTA